MTTSIRRNVYVHLDDIVHKNDGDVYIYCVQGSIYVGNMSYSSIHIVYTSQIMRVIIWGLYAHSQFVHLMKL